MRGWAGSDRAAGEKTNRAAWRRMWKSDGDGEDEERREGKTRKPEEENGTRAHVHTRAQDSGWGGREGLDDIMCCYSPAERRQEDAPTGDMCRSRGGGQASALPWPRARSQSRQETGGPSRARLGGDSAFFREF